MNADPDHDDMDIRPTWGWDNRKTAASELWEDKTRHI